MHRDKKTFSTSNCRVGGWKIVFATFSTALVFSVMSLNLDAMITIGSMPDKSCRAKMQGYGMC